MKIDYLTPGLYVILDRSYVKKEDLVRVAIAVSKGGCRIIQYRDKISKYPEIRENSFYLRRAVQRPTLLIINDYIDIVTEAEFDGVHLGQNDCPVNEARKKIGEDKIIGLSTHSKEQAIRADKTEADYLGYGPIYRTNTKPDVDPIGINNIREILSMLNKPLYAIGGINKENIEDVLEMGIRRVAIVSAILKSNNIEKTTRDYIKIMDDYNEKQKVKK